PARRSRREGVSLARMRCSSCQEEPATKSRRLEKQRNAELAEHAERYCFLRAPRALRATSSSSRQPLDAPEPPLGPDQADEQHEARRHVRERAFFDDGDAAAAVADRFGQR